MIILLNVDFFLDLGNALGCDITSSLEAISNLEWVNSLIKELLCLIKKSTSKHDYTCSSITDLVILRL